MCTIAGSIEGYIRPDEVDSRQVLEEENLTRFCLSQPELLVVQNVNAAQINLEERPGFSFSQPAHIEDLLLCTQVQTKQFTQASQVSLPFTYSFVTKLFKSISHYYHFISYLQQNTFQRLVRRMTRFFVKTELETTIRRLVNCLKNENYTYRINNFGTVGFVNIK